MDSNSKYRYSSKKRKYTCEDDDPEEHNDQHDKNIYIINNHLYFSSDITPKSAFTLCKYLRSLEIKLRMDNACMSADVKPEIYLHITTNGGCIYSAFSIIDCFKSLSIPVNTIIDSNVSSAGTIISIHVHKRYICTNSYVLVHELRSGCWGKLAYIEDKYKNCLKVQEHINQIYLEKTKITKKYLKEILVKDLELNAEECIRLGIADEIYISK